MSSVFWNHHTVTVLIELFYEGIHTTEWKQILYQVFTNHLKEELLELYRFEVIGEEHYGINFTALACFYFLTGWALSQPHYTMGV